jgi:hypothetical protein
MMFLEITYREVASAVKNGKQARFGSVVLLLRFSLSVQSLPALVNPAHFFHFFLASFREQNVVSFMQAMVFFM